MNLCVKATKTENGGYDCDMASETRLWHRDTCLAASTKNYIEKLLDCWKEANDVLLDQLDPEIQKDSTTTCV